MPLDATVQILTGQKAFSNVLESGIRRNQGPVTVVAKPNLREDSRVGLVVGRRLGGAVARNRARRRIRHALAAADIPTGFDFVVIARTAALNCSFQDLERALRTAVDRCARGEDDE